MEEKTGEELRDAAIEQVERNANHLWKARAARAVWEVAKEKYYFTTDDVVAKLQQIQEDFEQPVHTHEPRAWGAVMRSARTAGVIDLTDSFEKTEQPQAHCRPKRLWLSLVK